MNSTKKLFSLLLILFLLLVSCSDSEESSSASSKVEESLINLPQSISSTSVKKTANSSTADSIYEGVRNTIGSLEEFKDLMADIAISIEEEILPNGDEGEYVEAGVSTGQLGKIVWYGDPAGNYDTVVDLYWVQTDGTYDTLGAQIHISFSESRSKGKMVWDGSKIEGGWDNAKIEVTYNGIDSPKTMTIKAVGIDKGNTGDIDKAWIDAIETDAGTIEVSGGYYIPTPGTDFFKEDGATVERCYIFTANTDTDGNAELNLAIPPATVNSTTSIMTTYSVGAVTKEQWYPAIKTSWTEAGHTVANLESYLTLELTATTINDLSVAEMDTILKAYAAQHPEDAGISSFLFIVNLVNPAYYTSDGFYGTYDGTDGTLDAAPSWASAIPEDTLDVVVPSSLSALAFSSTNFTVE